MYLKPKLSLLLNLGLIREPASRQTWATGQTT
jgi:hypothetical protein